MVEIKLNKRYKYAGDIMPKLLEIGFDLETACDFLNSIKDADVAPKSEWISVNERLPEKDGRYLVAMKNGNEFHISTRKFKKADPPRWWKGHTYGYWARNTGGVRYWRPLPEPPITDKPTQE